MGKRYQSCAITQQIPIFIDYQFAIIIDGNYLERNPEPVA